jgi:hypothetical protein
MPVDIAQPLYSRRARRGGQNLRAPFRAKRTLMRHSLLLHPDSRCAAVERIETEVTRSAAGLIVRYLVTGDIRGLQLPLPSSPACADELWRHTCFELFLRAATQNAYCEFNFAPSLQWAAYRFDSYRQGMRPLEIPPPRIEMRQDSQSFELQADLELAGLVDAGEQSDLHLGLSAVIQETNGPLSYWALAHPGAKPDFHHPGAFALQFQTHAT